MTPEVVIDVAGGELRIGDMVLPLAESAPDGALRLLPPSGPVLRPITFGERLRRVERAAASADPVESLCTAITACATVSHGDRQLSPVELEACQTLALVLAGADMEAPAFTDAMVLLGRNVGWSYSDIEHAEAMRVDRLARRLEPRQQEEDDGWSRVVFAAPAPQSAVSVRRSLARRLLERFVEEPVADDEATFGGAGPAGASAAPGGAEDNVKGDAGPAETMGHDAGKRAAWNQAHGPAERMKADTPAEMLAADESAQRIAPENPQAMMEAGQATGMERTEHDEEGISRIGGSGKSEANTVLSAQIRTPAERMLIREQEAAAASASESEVEERPRARVLGYRLRGWQERGPGTPAAAEAVSNEMASASPVSGSAAATTAQPAVANDEGRAGYGEVKDGSGWTGRSAPAHAETGGWSKPGRDERFASAFRTSPVISRMPGSHHTGAASTVQPGLASSTAPAVAPAAESSPRWDLPSTLDSWLEPGPRPPLIAAGEGIARRPEEGGMMSIIMEFADALADLLNEESDLRGIDR